ncbi:RluA family pseudouridine synthase [Thermodesulfobacterium sp. TA1]|uniref:RluA family pseudouridine synthase n=1 Tax=Thermodesulfobacterium sp. TA1 TaxID=2234087 RepID=UPI001232D643|nr:RluA family pseudouridine synthase [Thermodesulfobacterium sp. TA1]QER42342.1 RluA family pseudouridine synthase [Thermodesulfobacterium sp. TA1]
MKKPVSILFEDKNLLVVNKPAGIVVQGARDSEISLLKTLKDFIKRRDQKEGGVFLAVVHRLDKPVSGALVLAKRTKAAKRISEAFRQKEVIKLYVAEVEGSLKGQSLIKTYLKWDQKAKKALVFEEHQEGAKESLTYYEVLECRKKRSLVLLFPITGRKHQLRAVLSYLGFPIVGDVRYGAKTLVLKGKAIGLHACFLRFPHPITKEPLEFLAPFPEYFSLGNLDKTLNLGFFNKKFEALKNFYKE